MDKLKVLYLSMDDVEKASVGMDQIINTLEKVYRLKGQGQVEMPSKIGVRTRPDVLIHAMLSVYSQLVGYDDTNNAELCFFSV